MRTLRELWPPYGLRISEGDLVLSVVTDDDLPELVDLALAGIHDPDRMPFATPWTDVEPTDLPANMVRFYSSVRAGFTAASFDVVCAVRVSEELVGTQVFSTRDFAVTRTGETGSWLGRRFQGQGIGTRMRRAICAFAFDGLGATEVTSGAFADNPASLAVSTKVGYRPNGTTRMQRRGAMAVNHKLVLTPDTFIRGAPVQLAGVAELRAFLRLD